MINGLLYPNWLFIRFIGIKNILKIITNMPNIFLNVFKFVLETLADNSFHFYWEQNSSWFLLNKYDKCSPYEFPYCPSLSLHHHETSFLFSKIFTIDRFAIKFFLNVNTGFISNSIIFLKKLSPSCKN